MKTLLQYYFLVTFVLIALSQQVNAQWNLVGDAIPGDNAEYQMLKYTEISGDGNVLIAGSTSGIVMVYENSGSSWMKIGETFSDESVLTNLVGECAISGDGNVVAMSGGSFSGNEYVCIFSRSGSDWIQKGDTLYPDGTEMLKFGYAIALSSDGNVIAISALHDNSNTGSVTIFEYDGTTWNLKGDKVFGETSEMMGWSLDISADGNVFIVGSEYHDDGGVASVYAFESDAWELKGSRLIAAESNAHFGASVSINNDGSIIAIGAPKSMDAENYGDDVGYVEVYEFVGTDWQQVGDRFYGNSENSEAGSSVSLNAAGDLLAVGSPGYAIAGGTEARGLVDVLKLYDGIWRPYGNEELPGYSIYGETVDDDEMGTEVSLNASGNTVAIGIPGRDANGITESGVIEVYANANISNDVNQSIVDSNIEVYPTVVTDAFMLYSDNDISLELINVHGICMLKNKFYKGESHIDISHLATGMYFIRIKKNEIYYFEKIIKK